MYMSNKTILKLQLIVPVLTIEMIQQQLTITVPIFSYRLQRERLIPFLL